MVKAAPARLHPALRLLLALRWVASGRPQPPRRRLAPLGFGNHDYVIVCAGDRYVANVNTYANGTHVITVRFGAYPKGRWSRWTYRSGSWSAWSPGLSRSSGNGCSGAPGRGEVGTNERRFFGCGRSSGKGPKKVLRSPSLGDDVAVRVTPHPGAPFASHIRLLLALETRSRHLLALSALTTP